MSAKIQKRISTGAGESEVVRYVLVDRDRISQTVKGGSFVAPKKERMSAPAKAAAQKTAVKRDAKKATGSSSGQFTVLKTVKPANPYLSTPEEALNIAKRAGIFDRSGKLKSIYK